ncbi:MarR family transcriptional regulator [Micromonospora sp. HM134]|uniref:MarR family winged helix-turn-helix transcriptional regulator n=1 Tax=Micromonospora sp. HM134 TaxID=2583243 RepID=UPI001198B171|nr:MarR family transcriptional regulator [Micromonospora sp. HM134]QDY10064.1 MarR family transcriptional regulator [Micromonospora sp. HM134]
MGLAEQLGEAMQAYQRAVDVLDQRAADLLGLNRTDMRCLELLFAPEPPSPGELAVAAGMTTGGVTTAIDRLERAGYATRERDTADRRRVTVRPTEAANRKIGAIYGPIVTDGQAFLRRYDDETLAHILEFITHATRSCHEHAERLGR